MAAAMTLFSGVAASGQSTPAPALSGDEIFANVRSAWQVRTTPQFVSYTVAVDALKNGHEVALAYQGHLDEGDDSFHVDRFSSQELADPHVARGIKVFFVLPAGFAIDLSRKPEPTDYIGFPSLSPRYSFGLQRSVIVDSPEAADANEGAGLRTIGRVKTIGRDYDITVLGTETIDGRPAYHLKLVPVRSPDRFRLRELWASVDTFATLRLIVARNFSSGPPLGTSWTVDFTSVDGTQYITSECADHSLRVDRTTYTNYCISFEALSFSSRPPGPMLTLSLPDQDDGELREP